MRDRNASLTTVDVGSLAWDKMDGLLPAAVTERGSGQLLMLGYMNAEALAATLATGLVTFYSRSRQRLWQKGEASGNVLRLEAIFADCDDDALVVIAEAKGPTCHLGTRSCFGGDNPAGPGWLADLAKIVAQRAVSGDASSYTCQLLDAGPERIAQKIGEEGVEVALAAVTRGSAACAEEIADLVYHLTVLMECQGFGWEDVITVLKERHELRASNPTVSS